MPFNIKPPKNDDEYFERMTHAIFQAGLNWKMVENKWPNLRKAFADFSIDRVARFGDREVERLMKDTGIIRNEKKIRSVIANAREFQRIKGEYRSFPGYIRSFHGSEQGMAYDLQERFKHLGSSSARMYMWMIGMKLKPNAEEKAWIASHDKEHHGR
ncbi:MAG: DNA-3-methyladenine glycosylase I [Candidatus Micrarchaeota archaeon]|nr:DNA-3-methyladenine glycosylase I [Candidatus Micrarchaeota archaeon]